MYTYTSLYIIHTCIYTSCNFCARRGTWGRAPSAWLKLKCTDSRRQRRSEDVHMRHAGARSVPPGVSTFPQPNGSWCGERAESRWRAGGSMINSMFIVIIIIIIIIIITTIMMIMIMIMMIMMIIMIIMIMIIIVVIIIIINIVIIITITITITIVVVIIIIITTTVSVSVFPPGETCGPP